MLDARGHQDSQVLPAILGPPVGSVGHCRGRAIKPSEGSLIPEWVNPDRINETKLFNFQNPSACPEKPKVKMFHPEINKDADVAFLKTFDLLSLDAKYLKIDLEKSLHDAVERNDPEFVESLLTKGADVDARNAGNMTPLHVATVKGHLAVAGRLLSRGASVAASIYDGKFRRRTVEKFHSTNRRETEDPDFSTERFDGDPEFPEANFSRRENFRGTSVYFAVRNADARMTKLLLDGGADARHNPNLLGAAIDTGNPEIVEIFLARNVDVNGSDAEGNSALHRAILTAHGAEDAKAAIVRSLVARGADVCRRNRSGQTALHVAARRGYATLVETLLGLDKKNSEDPEDSAENSNFRTQFKRAAQLCARNKTGETALHVACARNHRKVVEILLRNGIDIGCRTVFGKTALDVAFENGCRQSFVLLLDYGADINVAYVANIPRRNRPSFSVIKYGRGEFITSNRFCVESIRRHIVRVKCAGRRVTAGSLRCLDDGDEALCRYRHECEEEVRNLGLERICGNVTFCDVLRRRADRLAVCAGNESVARVLESQEFGEKFPIYRDMIRCNFRRGQVRAVLLNAAAGLFYSAVEYFVPAEILLRNVFAYLRNEDLTNLIEACEARM